MIAKYPEYSEITMELRPLLHPKFQNLAEGISELTFSNIYLFRQRHNYRISELKNGLFVITGKDDREPFFILPFELPGESVLKNLFEKYQTMKCVSQPQAEVLENSGYSVIEDRDNFDYLYSREDLVNLTGRKFHKKKKEPIVSYIS